MCAEAAPQDCHRHHAICGPHFPQAVHLCGNQRGMTARELQAKLDVEGDVDDTPDLFR